MRTACRASSLSSWRPPWAATLQKRLVGRRAPQEEREARGQVLSREEVVGPGRHAVGLLLEPEEEAGAGEERLQRRPHALLEAVDAGAGLVERHEAVHVAGGGGTAVGPAGESLDDPPGAGLLLFRAGGPADEDALSAGGLGEAGDRQRTSDDQLSEVGQGW